MKRILIAFFTLVATSAKAQIVNIPDSNFKNHLLNYFPAIDINQDGEIQASEALNVTSLYIPYSSNQTVRDITGIREFKNLDTLYSPGDSVRILDISGLAKLLYFSGGADSVTPNCFLGCTNLKKILMGRIGHAGTFNPGNLDSLESFECIDCNIDTMDLRRCSSLINFTFSPFNYSRISYLYLSNLKKLKNFNFSVLIGPDFSRSVIKHIDLSGCSNLLYITGDSPGFKDLSHLNVSGCSSLQNISMLNTSLTNLDLSTCYNLQVLNFYSNEIINLNIKNGIVSRGGIFSVPSGSNICADDTEIPIIMQYASEGGVLINITSYCTFYPGGLQNTISGITRLDVNNNGCNNTDRTSNHIPIKITDTAGNIQINYSGPNGYYKHYAGKGFFTLKPYFPYPYFTVNPGVFSVRFDTANNLAETGDFCIQPIGIHNDLEITFLPTWPAASPGFNAAYTLVYKNRGTTTLSGNVSLNFDNSKMNFVTASENVTSQSTGQLVWAYNNLQPFESKSIYVSFNLLPPPVNNINDTIVYLASITPSANDETTFDNSFVLPQRIIGSYDPNDKECLEGSKLDIAKIGDYLHYIIHFQNEGTDTAFNIVVADTLSNKLDWSTFEFIKASHPVDAKLTNNKAEFIFKNIKLPYKAINEPASHGWVAFKIKPKPSVVIGDSLNNNAAIYFDFNKPVITNTATTIVSSSSTPVPVKLEYFSVNQKNNTNVLNWKASCSYGNATFIIERSEDGIHFSSIGNINATALRCQLPLNYTDNNPLVGKNYYRLKITDADGISFYSKILVIGNGKAGLQITAIANNSIYLNSNKQQTIQLKVIAADGREILSEKQIVAAGNNSINLQMKNAAKGIYTLIIFTNEGATINKRFIK